MSNASITSEKSNGSANANDSMSFSADQLREVKLLENTPFAIVKVDNKYFVGCGPYRITELFDTPQEAIQYAQEINWNNITTVIGVIVQEEIKDALAKYAAEQYIENDIKENHS